MIGDLSDVASSSTWRMAPRTIAGGRCRQKRTIMLTKSSPPITNAYASRSLAIARWKISCFWALRSGGSRSMSSVAAPYGNPWPGGSWFKNLSARSNFLALAALEMICLDSSCLTSGSDCGNRDSAIASSTASRSVRAEIWSSRLVSKLVRAVIIAGSGDPIDAYVSHCSRYCSSRSGISELAVNASTSVLRTLLGSHFLRPLAAESRTKDRMAG